MAEKDPGKRRKMLLKRLYNPDVHPPSGRALTKEDVLFIKFIAKSIKEHGEIIHTKMPQVAHPAHLAAARSCSVGDLYSWCGLESPSPTPLEKKWRKNLLYVARAFHSYVVYEVSNQTQFRGKSYFKKILNAIGDFPEVPLVVEEKVDDNPHKDMTPEEQLELAQARVKILEEKILAGEQK